MVLDHYLDAGFNSPKHIILDTLDFQGLFKDKFRLSHEQVQLSFADITKRLYRAMKHDKDMKFKIKERKDIINKINKI